MRWQDVYVKFGSDRQSGFGVHDSPNKYLNPPNVTNHARTLKRYGIDNYKILADADNKKAGRVQVYRQHGIHSIVRTHVDRPTPNFVIDLQVARDYVNAGAWAIEPMNEPNLKDEWRDGTFPSSWTEYGKIVARQWIRNADVILAAGGVPVTPALSPGGHVPHREATLRFLDGINFHGGRGQLDRAVIGVHWRPLNNPIDTPPGIGNPPNTTLWRENEWFFATYSAFLGYMPGFVETESGYSPGSSENGTFPPMTQATWASFNQELYSRLNPTHAKATPGQVICQDYWIEGTDGSGVWRIDAAFINWLEDNQPPDEPLWGKAIRTMGINWDRKVLVSGGTTPPPPDNPVPPIPVPPPSNTLPPRVLIDMPTTGFTISVAEPSVVAGEKFWRAVRVERRRGASNGGQHHIYHTEPHDPAVTMVVGVLDTPVVNRIPHDKPANEPAANHPMTSNGNRYWSRVEGRGIVKSDQVNGMMMFEGQHESLHITWELVTQPIGDVPVFDMTTRFVQLATAKWGNKFEDLRTTLPKHATLKFSAIDSRLMQYICFHHTTGAVNTTWKRIAEGHVNDRGFAGIGYHIGVRQGKVALLGDLDTQRAHVKDRNDEALGVAWMGNSDMVNVPSGDQQLLKEIVEVLDALYTRDKELTWHGKMLPAGYTECPGSSMKQIVPNLRATVPVPPPVVIQWDKVAFAIEVGARLLQTEGYQREHDVLLGDVSYADAVRERDK